MAYNLSTPQVGVSAITAVDTVQRHPLGTRVKAAAPTYGEGEFIYLKGVANTARGSWVTFAQGDGSTALLAANAIGPVGIAMAATVADTYGWYQIYGKAVGKCATGYADNGLVYATATAGTIDDAVVAGDRVKLAIGASAIGTPAAGLAEFEIQYPYMDDATAA